MITPVVARDPLTNPVLARAEPAEEGRGQVHGAADLQDRFFWLYI